MKKFCPGLTLIELLVVMAITALIAGGSLAAYSSFNKSQTVKAVASDLKNNLRLVQGKASAQEKPATCPCLSGYQVVINSPSYSIQAFCHVENPAPADNPCGSPQSFSVPTNVSLSPDTTVKFWSLTGGATPATITVSGFGRSAVVNVTKTGEIY